MSLDKLNVSNFFHQYIFIPQSKKLSSRDKKIALLGTLLIAMTLGIGHGVCGLIYLYHRKIKKSPLQDTQNIPIVSSSLSHLKKVIPTSNPSHPINCKDLEKNHPLNQPVVLFIPEESSKEKQRIVKGFLELTYNWYTTSQNIGPIEPDEKLKIHENLLSRIKQYDEVCEFSNKLHPDFAKLILMEDFECAIANSPIPYAIMTSEEVLNLKESQINALNYRQFKMIKEKLSRIPFGTLNLGLKPNFSLADFINTENINDIISTLDLRFMVLLSQQQIQQLDLKKVSKDRLNALMGNFYEPWKTEEACIKSKINLLSVEQISSNPSLFSSDELKLLRKEKLQQLDPILFEKNFLILSYSRVNDFLKKQIDLCLKLFGSELVGSLTPMQIKNLDYSYFAKMTDETKKTFVSLFRRIAKEALFKHFEETQLSILLPYFDASCRIFDLMTIEQVPLLKFPMPFTQVQFHALFPQKLYGDDYLIWKENVSLIIYLTDAQIKPLLPLFTSVQTSLLTKEQLQAINFNRPDVKLIVPKMFALPDDNLLHSKAIKVQLKTQFSFLSDDQRSIVNSHLDSELKNFYSQLD